MIFAHHMMCFLCIIVCYEEWWTNKSISEALIVHLCGHKAKRDLIKTSHHKHQHEVSTILKKSYVRSKNLVLQSTSSQPTFTGRDLQHFALLPPLLQLLITPRTKWSERFQVLLRLLGQKSKSLKWLRISGWLWIVKLLLFSFFIIIFFFFFFCLLLSLLQKQTWMILCFRITLLLNIKSHKLRGK